MDKQFFVVDYDNAVAGGNSVEEALDNYREEYGNNYDVEELTFYQGYKLIVEQKLVVKPVVVEKAAAVPAKKAAAPANKKVKILNV